MNFLTLWAIKLTDFKPAGRCPERRYTDVGRLQCRRYLGAAFLMMVLLAQQQARATERLWTNVGAQIT